MSEAVAPGSTPSGTDVASTLRRVADDVIARGARAYRPRWEDTPLLSGLLAAGAAIAGSGGESGYVGFVEEWLTLHLARPIGYGRRGEPGFRPGAPAEDEPRLAISDYCGSWGGGHVALQAYRVTGEEGFRDAGLEIAGYVRDQASRLLDGGFEHFRGNGRFWVDTLYYAAPLLALAGAVSGETSFYDEASLQCEVHARYLQDPTSGCFYHNYEAATGRADTTGFWGRGNGWIAMSLVETLAELPADHARRPALERLLGTLFRGLLERQHRTGLWRVVLDHPDASLETSGTAMMGYALARAAVLRLGGGAEEMGAWSGAAQRAWRGLTTYVRDERGRVELMGAEAPAGGGDWERHKRVAVGEQPYATGPFLSLGACLL